MIKKCFTKYRASFKSLKQGFYAEICTLLCLLLVVTKQLVSITSGKKLRLAEFTGKQD